MSGEGELRQQASKKMNLNPEPLKVVPQESRAALVSVMDTLASLDEHDFQATVEMLNQAARKPPSPWALEVVFPMDIASVMDSWKKAAREQEYEIDDPERNVFMAEALNEVVETRLRAAAQHESKKPDGACEKCGEEVAWREMPQPPDWKPLRLSRQFAWERKGEGNQYLSGFFCRDGGAHEPQG